MNINLDMKHRSTLAELARRESAKLQAVIASKSGEVNRELVEHVAYLATAADLLMTSFEPDRAATVAAKVEE